MFFNPNDGPYLMKEEVVPLLQFYRKKYNKTFPPYNNDDYPMGAKDFVRQLKEALAGEDLEQIKKDYHAQMPTYEEALRMAAEAGKESKSK